MLNRDAIEKLAELGAGVPQGVEGPDGAKYYFAPPNFEMQRVGPLEDKLPRIRQAVTLHDRDSLIAYVNRYKTEQTRIFAEPGFLAAGGANITAIIDYHEQEVPHYGIHTATFRPRYSEEWKIWKAICGKPLAQAEFAEFIEENRKDIVRPAAANLLDIVRTFKANKKTEYDSVVYQRNGSVLMNYSEKVEAQGQSAELPEVLTIGIPVYFRDQAFSVDVFVRYRVGNGGVKFDLKIDRADVIEDAAFESVCGIVTHGRQATDGKAEIAGTGIEVYLGRRG